MSAEVEVFDLSKVRETISERIRMSFLNMIPDSEWSKLVDREIKAFFAETPAHYSNERSMPSPFARLVQAELEKIFLAALKTEMEKPEYYANWNEWGCDASSAVKKIVLDNSGQIVAAAFAGSIQNAVNILKNNLR